MHVCNRCGKLPVQMASCSDVYLTLPTQHHREGFEAVIQKMNYAYEVIEEGYLIKRVDFEGFIQYLGDFVFNSVEQKDVMVLAMHCGAKLEFSSLKNYKRLSDWLSHIQGQEVMRIIEKGQIKTLFQPIIHGQTGTIYGYEALSRGIMSDGSLMSPEVLFKSAKALDMMFFLDRVCREASLRAAAQQEITQKLFINFVPTAIYEPELCLQSTAKVLRDVNLREDQVVFEVVETELVEDFSHLNRILDYYRNKGYSTALDDIGSGYSNIDALIKLKPNYMKIDMDIVRDIHMSLENQHKLDAFILNGKEIGLTILAEGVETQDEFEFLKQKGVDLFQGYLFGRPEEVPRKI